MTHRIQSSTRRRQAMESNYVRAQPALPNVFLKTFQLDAGMSSRTLTTTEKDGRNA